MKPYSCTIFKFTTIDTYMVIASTMTIPKLKTDISCVCPETVPPGTVFGKGVDVRVVPESHRLDAVAPQGLNAHVAAGSAADMQQQLHFDHLMNILSDVIVQQRARFEKRGKTICCFFVKKSRIECPFTNEPFVL